MKNVVTLHLWEFVPSWAEWCFGATILKYSFGEENIQNDSGGKFNILGGYIVGIMSKKVHVNMCSLLSGYRGRGF
jgi:hypothetical protein